MSKFYFSKIGATLSLVYILTTGAAVVYALTCHGEFCGFMALIFFTPWTFFSGMENPVGLFFCALLNATALYFLGLCVGLLAEKWKNKIA